MQMDGQDIKTLALVGATKVGKTSFFKYIQGRNSGIQEQPTIAIQYGTLTGNFGTVKMIDTAGQEKFAAIGDQYIHSAQILAFFVCPFEEQNWIELTKFWFNKCLEYSNDHKIIMIISKSDLKDERNYQAKYEAKIKEYENAFKENGSYIGTVFVSIYPESGDWTNQFYGYLKTALEQIQSNDNVIDLNVPKKQTSNSSCCN